MVSNADLHSRIELEVQAMPCHTPTNSLVLPLTRSNRRTCNAGVGNGTQNNFFSNQLRHQEYRGWLARIDHRISSTQSIFGKYYHGLSPEDRQDCAGVVNGFPTTQRFEFRTNDGGNIDYTNAINSNFVFDIRVSLNRFVQERRSAQSFDPAQLGFAAASLAAMRGYQYSPRIMIRNLDATRPIRSTLAFGNNTDAAFGILTTQRNNPRDIQFGAKFTF